LKKQKIQDMKIRSTYILSVALLLISLASFSQDKRTLDTKVADLLALLPSSDPEYTSKLMNDMLSLGDEGIKKICDQIIPAGTGDDTPQRFAVESLSRYLSQSGKEDARAMWEKLCIAYATAQKDITVKDFFMKQLQMIGGNASVEALKKYLSDKELCEPALAVIASAGGAAAEKAMSEALKNRDLPCAASVMNKLALMNSDAAVNDYITWASNSGADIKAAAYNALAQSGNPLAYPVLSAASKASGYKWEPTGATEALLNYAKAAAQKGNIKSVNKICKTLIAKCTDKLNMHYKTAALDTYVKINGSAAIPYLLDAVKNTDSKYRNAALRMSLDVPGQEIITKWIEVFPKAPAYSKPDIISALGLKKDKKATPLVKAALNNTDPLVRQEAAAALVSLEGKEDVPSLIYYMLKNSYAGDKAADS
jgi:HEAT repeat protein